MKLFYEDDEFTGKSPAEVADTIAAWRADNGQMMDAAFDLLNAIEPFLRGYESLLLRVEQGRLKFTEGNIERLSSGMIISEKYIEDGILLQRVEAQSFHEAYAILREGTNGPKKA